MTCSRLTSADTSGVSSRPPSSPDRAGIPNAARARSATAALSLTVRSRMAMSP